MVSMSATRPCRTETTPCGGIADALVAGLHVLGGERRAVVELDVGAKAEGVDLRVW